MAPVDVTAIGTTIEVEGCPPIKSEVIENCDGVDVEMLLSDSVCGRSGTIGVVGDSDSELVC